MRVTRTRKRATEQGRDPDTDPEVAAIQAEYDRQDRFAAMWSQKITDPPAHGYDALDYLPYRG